MGMTREETNMITFDVLHFVADNAGLSTFEAIEKAYNMGVSEQKAVLDKIRADIGQLPSYVAKFNGGDFAIHIDKEKVFEIIDKYKEESEG